MRNIYDCYINLPQGIFISDFLRTFPLSDCVLFKFTENVSFTELTGVSRTQQNVEDNWIVFLILFFFFLWFCALEAGDCEEGVGSELYRVEAGTQPRGIGFAFRGSERERGFG